MTWNDIAIQFIQAVLPVLVAALVALVGYGIAYLRKQTEAISNETARKALNDALTEAEFVATDAIRATNQVLVDALKEKAADGKLTKEEAVEAMNAAKRYFVSHLSNGSKKILEAALGPVNEWLEGFLEARLATEKQNSIQAKVSAIANPTSPDRAA